MWVDVPVYVSLHFMFGCLSFPLKKNKFVSYYLFIMCKFQLITMNKKNEKQTPHDVYNKDADQTVPPHNLMPVFIQFYSF